MTTETTTGVPAVTVEDLLERRARTLRRAARYRQQLAWLRDQIGWMHYMQKEASEWDASQADYDSAIKRAEEAEAELLEAGENERQLRESLDAARQERDAANQLVIGLIEVCAHLRA